METPVTRLGLRRTHVHPLRRQGREDRESSAVRIQEAILKRRPSERIAFSTSGHLPAHFARRSKARQTELLYLVCR